MLIFLAQNCFHVSEKMSEWRRNFRPLRLRKEGTRQGGLPLAPRDATEKCLPVSLLRRSVELGDGDGSPGRQARIETIRKQQAIWGLARETFPVRSFGLCPNAWSLPVRPGDPSGVGPAEVVSFRRRARHGANRPGEPLIPDSPAVSDLSVPASLCTKRALVGRTDFLPCCAPGRLVS